MLSPGKVPGQTVTDRQADRSKQPPYLGLQPLGISHTVAQRNEGRFLPAPPHELRRQELTGCGVRGTAVFAGRSPGLGSEVSHVLSQGSVPSGAGAQGKPGRGLKTTAGASPRASQGFLGPKGTWDFVELFRWTCLTPGSLSLLLRSPSSRLAFSQA